METRSRHAQPGVNHDGNVGEVSGMATSRADLNSRAAVPEEGNVNVQLEEQSDEEVYIEAKSEEEEDSSERSVRRYRKSEGKKLPFSLKELPSFDDVGNNNPYRFVTALKDIFGCYEYPRYQWCKIIPSLLKGEPRLWWESRCKPTRWEDFEAPFLERYGGRVYKYRLNLQMDSLKADRSLSPKTYASKMLELYSLMPQEVGETEKVDRIISGLRPEDRTMLMMAEVHSMAQLMAKIEVLEFRESHRDRTSKEQRGGSSTAKETTTSVRPSKPDIVCYRCNERGHTRRFCKKDKPKSEEEQQDQRRKDRSSTSANN